jgi:hypothetical protein
VTATWLATTADLRIHRETKRRPLDLYLAEKPHLLPLPAQPYDTAETVYRTVNSEGHVPYRQNFYSVPGQRIGELLPVRITEKELIVYGPDVTEIARHELFPRGTAGQRRIHPDHLPGRDPQQKYIMLKQRFAEFGAEGILFFEQLVKTRRYGKEEASRVLGLLSTYHREDLQSPGEGCSLSRFLPFRRRADPRCAGSSQVGFRISRAGSARTLRGTLPTLLGVLASRRRVSRASEEAENECQGENPTEHDQGDESA